MRHSFKLAPHTQRYQWQTHRFSTAPVKPAKEPPQTYEPSKYHDQILKTYGLKAQGPVRGSKPGETLGIFLKDTSAPTKQNLTHGLVFDGRYVEEKDIRGVLEMCAEWGLRTYCDSEMIKKKELGVFRQSRESALFDSFVSTIPKSDVLLPISGKGGESFLLNYVDRLHKSFGDHILYTGCGFSNQAPYFSILLAHTCHINLTQLLYLYYRHVIGEGQREKSDPLYYDTPPLATYQNARDILTGVCHGLETKLKPLNGPAEKMGWVSAPIIGGNDGVWLANLSKIKSSYVRGRAVLFEGYGYQHHQADRQIKPLAKFAIDNGAAYIIFGAMLESHPHPMTQEIEQNDIGESVEAIAKQTTTPVFRLPTVGHGANNIPISYGPSTVLTPDKRLISLFTRSLDAHSMDPSAIVYKPASSSRYTHVSQMP